MSKIIKIDELALEITSAVQDYTKEVSKAVDKEVSSTATKVKKEIKDNSPYDEKGSDPHYRDGWSRKTSRKSGETVVTIYNKDKPQLTHLLEFGHAIAGGKGRVAGIPHIIPAYEKYVPKMEKNIEKIIENGG